MSGGGAHKLPFQTGFDHLVYVRIFEGCNLHCAHCFIPANPKRMEHTNIARIPELVRKIATPGQTILLQWHGGEPTLFGADWLRTAIALVHENGPDFVWRHGIQTNLMTYDEAWAHLYREHFEGEVGISWDPVLRLTRKGDLTSAEEFEARFWPKLDRLVADGLTPYLVATATKTFFATFPDPTSFFDLMVAHGVRKAHLERVTRTGSARANWEWLGLDNAEFSRQMARFLRAYVQWKRQFADQGEPVPLMLSPFDGLLASAARLRAGQAGGYGCWSGTCDTRFHTIDANGYKRGCTALTSEIDNKRARNVLAIPDPAASRATRRFHCQTCPFRRICSSGCLAVNIDDGSGECSGGFRLFEAADQLVTRGLAADA